MKNNFIHNLEISQNNNGYRYTFRVGPEQDLNRLPCGLFDSAFDYRGVDSCEAGTTKKLAALTSLLCSCQAPG